uniref:Uncharacterized protein n=1 Tax=Trypanosoma vivax (strain Y486) TaxID=1055687 RepID=G0TSV9_TRYVY|nr:conserved hypothetical protein [Trypanosoma vivax Y486]
MPEDTKKGKYEKEKKRKEKSTRKPQEGWHDNTTLKITAYVWQVGGVPTEYYSPATTATVPTLPHPHTLPPVPTMPTPALSVSLFVFVFFFFFSSFRLRLNSVGIRVLLLFVRVELTICRNTEKIRMISSIQWRNEKYKKGIQCSWDDIRSTNVGRWNVFFIR